MREKNYHSLIFLLFAELKPYDPVDPKGTVELTINMLHKREKGKHKRSREKRMEY